MYKERLNQLLDSIYELEGLVHLALGRDDNPARLPDLIRHKGEELALLAANVDAHVGNDEPCAGADTPLYIVAGEEEVMESGGVTEPLENIAGSVSDMVGSEVKKDSLPVEEDMQSVVEAVFNSLPEEVVSSPAVADAASEEVSEPSAESVEVPEAYVPIAEPTPPAYDEASTYDEASALLMEDKRDAASSHEPRGKLVFSINDRYRFKRELFSNSDADFNNTLALVASMENFDEAEDYFLSELQWDQKRGEVVDFLEILKRYFKE